MENVTNNPPITSAYNAQTAQVPATPIVQETKPDISKKDNKFLKIVIYLLVSIILICLGVFGYEFYQKKVAIPQAQINPEPTFIVQPTKQPLNANSTLAVSHNTFGFKLLKQLQEKDGDNNIVISPSSIALALSMTYNGADKETKEAMAKTLEIQGIDINEINKQSANLISNLTNPDPKVEISIANSIWGKEGKTFNPTFLEDNNKYYGAKIDYLDFSNPSSADTINNWVSDKTKGKIPTIIQPPISPDVVMYLINAIYFKGNWTVEFDKKLTEDKQFSLTNGNQKKHPMMKQQRDDFNYLENDLFQAVSLPYGKNKRLRMFLFLPKKSLSNFILNLNITNWKQWLSLFKETEGTVILPKFKIEYEKMLIDSLSSLGMGIAFSPQADFTKIAPGLFISGVIHKTFIEVNEEGTEAAAVTAEIMEGSSINNTKKVFYMEINKPFFFAIQDSQTEEILFTGFIIDPK